jgi:G:T-mismatch repair DNA endonuclease (very short patch repair protein)
MHKTKEQITYNMQQVKSKDTKIEVMLRKELVLVYNYGHGKLNIL